MSATSYHLVEKPFRSRDISRRVLIAVPLLASSVVICISLYWIMGDGIPGRGNYVQDLITAGQRSKNFQNGVDCHNQWGDVSDSCVFENSPTSPTLVLVGDSHAARLAASVRMLASENQLNFVQVTTPGCPYFIGLDHCKGRGEALSTFVKRFENPTIIYSARLPLYIEREPYHNHEIADNSTESAERERAQSIYPEHQANAVVNTLTTWVDDGFELVIVYPVPEQGFHVAAKLKRQYPFASSADQLPTFSTSYDEYRKRVASSYEALNEVTGSRVRRVYPERIFCHEDTDRCIASESDRLYFFDDGHVTALGSDLIVREVAAALRLQVPSSFGK